MIRDGLAQQVDPTFALRVPTGGVDVGTRPVGVPEPATDDAAVSRRGRLWMERKKGHGAREAITKMEGADLGSRWS